MAVFPEIKKNFGFGCMRFPMNGDEVDTAAVCDMVDAFIAAGFNYFDTAHGYIGGKSETALRECLTSRYPREAYVLTNKLSDFMFQCPEDVRPALEEQLAACGVEYFDFYLMHAQNHTNYIQYRECKAYETALELRREGKIRHLGLSFHDSAAFLDQLLTEHPEVEVVQLQFNYLDYEDETVQARLCYEVCRRHGKPIIVMEPVKGGRLVKLPDTAQAVLDELHGGSNAEYAIRFAAGYPGVEMVLSGMGSMEMMTDNIGYMRDFQPLNDREQEALQRVCAILRCQDIISCTGCRYCVAGCPMEIAIPDHFARANAIRTFNNWYAPDVIEGGAPSACIECGQCEAACPQHLEIRRLLNSLKD